MKLLPKSSDGWRKLVFFPFRLYVFAAFATEYLMVTLWPRHGGSPPGWVIYITLGYVVSFIAFFIGGFDGLASRRYEAALWHFIFAGLAFIFGVYSLRFLASA